MIKNTIKSLDVGLSVVLLLSVVYSFVQVFYGMEYPDTFYWISRYSSVGVLDSFGLLNQGLFVLTTKLLGGYLISYKIIVWFFYALGMISCLWYGYHLTENKTLLYLGTIIGFLCLPKATYAFAFNGNGLTMLGVVLMLLSIDSYIKGNKYALIWIGILMAYLPLVRFPNIVACIMVLCITPLLCTKWNEYVYIVLSLLGGLMLYLLICSIVYGGYKEFFTALKDAFIQSSDPSSNHSISHLIEEYLHSLKEGVSYYKLLFLLAIVPLLGYFTSKKKYAWILAITTMLSFIIFIKLRVVSHQWFYPWFVSCIFMMLCIIVCVFAVIRGDKQLLGWGLLPIGLGLCCCAGSDTGLTLFWGPICAMSPFILIEMNSVWDTTNKNELIWVIISFLGIALCAALYCRVDTMIFGVVGLVLLVIVIYIVSKKITFDIDNLVFDSNNADIPIRTTLATIILCSSFMLVYARIRWQDWGNQPLYTYIYPIDEPKLKGIHTTFEQKKWIEEVMKEYRKLNDSKNVVFYGVAANIFPYLADIQPMQGVDFLWEENESNLQVFIMAIESYPVVFLCPYNPGYVMYNFDSYPQINEYLLSRGYTKEQHEHFAIYFPQQDTIE